MLISSQHQQPNQRRCITNSTKPEVIRSEQTEDHFHVSELLSLHPRSSPMKWKRFLSIPIFAVFTLMGFVYYITVFIFINDWVGLQSSAGSLNSAIFSLLVSLCLFSFVVCVLTDPGGIPSNYVPDVERSSASDQELHKNVQAKHCDKCSVHKPPRAHHCRVCRRCVLRMDHHCMWINNCVGYWNYKAFFVCIIYATLGSIYSTALIVYCAFQKDWSYSERLPPGLHHAVCGAFMLALSITLGTLLGWHIYLISRNMTTIEYYEGIRAAWLARKSGQTYRHPFDINVYRNFTLVLGSSVLKWLCPTSVSHLKDGTSFQTCRDM